MKRRFADGRNNGDILEKKFKSIRVDNNFFNGYIAKLKILKVRNKWCVDTEERCILDNNYTWIEVYPDNSNYVITIMLDNNDEIKEWYFDICKDIGVIDNIPYEDDLYLDLVIVPDGRYHVLDEDELKEALDNNDITIELYNLAYEKLDYLKTKYLSDINELETFTKKLVKLV